MEHGFVSQLLLWFVGGLSALGLLLTTVAFWSMGRAAYRKD